jgi:hypothetical protein
MGTLLSGESGPGEGILATVKEELVHRLQLHVEAEGVNNITVTAVAAAIQARWLSI